ncbi:PTS glucose/sucrose transporter subunit IIB, partial [Listeria monocytogenes]|nr:PTS glucose/sucrose transporter subunit IIB [Listeria monocytogenes]
MGKYQALSKFILENVGGKENGLSVTHCMTRVRFTLKDESKVNEDILKKSSEIMT